MTKPRSQPPEEAVAGGEPPLAGDGWIEKPVQSGMPYAGQAKRF